MFLANVVLQMCCAEMEEVVAAMRKGVAQR